MSTDPGFPGTDALAAERFRTVLTDIVRVHSDAACADDGGFVDEDVVAREVLGFFPASQFVYDVNANGVAVRRLVVHGEWEVDPNPPIPASAETCGARLPDLEGRRCRLIRGHTAKHWAEYSSLK